VHFTFGCTFFYRKCNIYVGGKKVIASEVDVTMLISKFVGKAVNLHLRGEDRDGVSRLFLAHWLANISSAR
jgi:hypothetical protein